MSILGLPSRSRRLLKDRLFWRQAIIVSGVLAAGALLPLGLPPRFHIAIIGLPILAAGVLLLLHYPSLGLVALIAASLVVRFSVPAIGLPAVFLIGLSVLWVFDMVVRRRRIMLIPSPTILPLLFLIATTILAFIMGQLPWYPLTPAPMDGQIGGMAIFILSFMAYLLAAHQVTEIRWLKTMTFVFLALSSIYMVGRLTPVTSRFVGRYIFHPATIGSLFWVWVVAQSFSQAIYNRQLSFRWRAALLGLTLITLYAGLIQARGWTSGWVPPLVALLVILIVGSPRFAIPTIIVGGLIGLLSLDAVRGLIFIGDNEYSAITRVESWRIIAEIVKVNPILGLGPSNYRFYTPLFPILGWYVQFNSHNNYVDIVAQTGFLGLFFFLWFFWQTGRLGWQLLKRVPEGGFRQAYVYGAMGGLVATLVAAMLGDWVLPFAYNVGIEGMRASMFSWLFLGGLLALDQITKTETVKS